MMKIFFSISMMSFSMMMISLNHPMSMGFFILLQTIMICLFSGMLINSYWFSYILFLTFLGGLLVLFIYMASIASNELFYPSSKMKMIFLMIMMLTMLMSYNLKENLTWMNLSNNMTDTNKLIYITFFNNENTINLNKLYNNHNYLMMMMMMIYLFIALVAVVKITNISYGPIRST